MGSVAAEPAALCVTAVRAVLLIRPVRRELRVTLLLEPSGGEQQPILARPRNRIRGLPPALLELAASLARPPVPALPARDDPLHIKREPIPRIGLRHELLLWLGRVPLPIALFAGAAEELRAALPSAQLLRQLIAPRLPELLILGLIGRASRPRGSPARSPRSRASIRGSRSPPSASHRSQRPPA